VTNAIELLLYPGPESPPHRGGSDAERHNPEPALHLVIDGGAFAIDLVGPDDQSGLQRVTPFAAPGRVGQHGNDTRRPPRV
jgi:hypothetical protein